jgi:hypothetical protein
MRRFRAWIVIKGRMTRPSYDGYIDITSKREDLKKSIAQKLVRTSFPDGVGPDEIIIRELEELKTT